MPEAKGRVQFMMPVCILFRLLIYQTMAQTTSVKT